MVYKVPNYTDGLKWYEIVSFMKAAYKAFKYAEGYNAGIQYLESK